MAIDRVQMWAPSVGESIEIGQYTYTIINNTTEHHYVKAVATSKTETAYDSVPTEISINGQAYTVTSMEGCYEGCAALIGAPAIPNTVTSMDSCFKECSVLASAPAIPASVVSMIGCFQNCTQLKNNITVYNAPSMYNDIFTGTTATNHIYIVNGGSSSTTPNKDAIAQAWRGITNASANDNIHYEADDNPPPTIGTMVVTRGSLTDEQGVFTKWVDDDAEDDVKIIVPFSWIDSRLPEGEDWKNGLASENEYTIEIDGNSISPYSSLHNTPPYIVFGEKTNNSLTLYISHYENAGVVSAIVIDKYGKHSTAQTENLYNIFVMLDFYPGGEGMAIGKASERNGLDIAIPTTIGEGLDPPTVFKPTEDTEIVSGKTYYSDKDRIIEVTPQEGDNPQAKGWYEDTKAIDLSNYQFIVGEYNKKRNDSVFIVGSGKEEDGVETRLNLMEIGNDLITIGDSDEGHVEIDYHSMQLKDKEGDAYFYVSDLREKNDNYQATITETFIGDGTITSFTVQLPVSAEVSATDSSHSSNAVTRSRQVYTFTTAPNNGATITIIYKTTSQSAKAYTFGTRATGTVGAMSVAEGFRTTASGTYSHAEGMGTTASGNASHAEGFGTTASGLVSHAEGRETTATRASQTALGQYNIADTGGIDETTRGDYIVIVGNGTSSQRSNALTVDWNGNVEMALDTTATSGTDHDIYESLSVLAWTDVII